MKLTKCPNGHFYDADKHSECPYCNGGLETGSAPVLLPRLVLPPRPKAR